MQQSEPGGGILRRNPSCGQLHDSPGVAAFSDEPACRRVWLRFVLKPIPWDKGLPSKSLALYYDPGAADGAADKVGKIGKWRAHTKTGIVPPCHLMNESG